jgi:hypothetical protein
LKHALPVAQENVEDRKKLPPASKFFLLDWKKFLPVRAEIPVAASDHPEEHLAPPVVLLSQVFVASGLGVASEWVQLAYISSVPSVLAHLERTPLPEQGRVVRFLVSVLVEAWEPFHPASFQDHCDRESVHVLVWLDIRTLEAVRFAPILAVAQMSLALSVAILPTRALQGTRRIPLPGSRLP